MPLWIEAATRRISGQWAQHQIVKILAAPGHGGNFAGGEHHHFLFCQELCDMKLININIIASHTFAMNG